MLLVFQVAKQPRIFGTLDAGQLCTRWNILRNTIGAVNRENISAEAIGMMEGITLFPCSEPPDSFSLTLEWVYSEGLAKSLQYQTTHCLTLPLHMQDCLFKFISPTSLLTTFQLQEPSFCFLNLLKHSSCLCTCCSFLPGRLISLDFCRKDSLLLFRSQL